MHQCDPSEFLNNMPHLSLRRLEEVASSRHIEKQVLHREGCTRLHWHKSLFLNDRALVDNLHPYFILLTPRFQLHLGDSRNTGQCLATEAHGTNGEQVFCFADFGGGVPLEAQAGIGFRHTTAIVDNHNHRLASVFHHQINLGGTGIQSVLHQLFDC